MKKNVHLITVFSFFMCVLSAHAQIGIGTETPQGILDLESNDSGLVFPAVALTSTLVQSPVTNPNGGSLEPGTTIFNTNLTATGANDVHPGIYTWNGSRWQPQFYKKEFVKYDQTGGCQRTIIRQSNSNPNPNDAANIAGLTNQTFVPTYSGMYRIEVKTNYGSGRINDFTSGSESEISLATSEGAFFFEMSGPGVDIDPTSSSYDYSEGWSYTHSYSVENDIESPAIESYNVAHYGTLIYYYYLRAGNTYTFNLSNCIYTGHDYFINNGDSGDGSGHIGHYIPCSVEFEFIGE